MNYSETDIKGVFVFTPNQNHDERGVFLEAFTTSSVLEATGRAFNVMQINVSVSHQGTIRGIHYTRNPPGQAKFVQCLSGEILDVVVDLRAGSETFGQHFAFPLDDVRRRAVFVPEGLGHGFYVASDSATVCYATSMSYDPSLEFGIHPMDEVLSLPWPSDVAHIVSPKDLSAPSLSSLVASRSLSA